MAIMSSFDQCRKTSLNEFLTFYDSRQSDFDVKSKSLFAIFIDD